LVAIKNHEADRFIASRAPHIYTYLVHGTDAGLISERARLLVKNFAADDLQLVRMNGDDIASDPLLLIDEANSMGLFGGKRAILISAGAKAFVGALESLVAAPPTDCLVVIEAGSLKKDHALRKLVERLREAASIECYPDSARDVERLIDTDVRAAGLTIDPAAREALVQMLGGDRLTTRSELDKLIVYAHGSRAITREDVDLLVADASSLALDDAVNGAFDGSFAAVEDTAQRYFATGGDGSVLLGAAIRHALVLHRMCLDAEAGASLENLPMKYGRFGSGAKSMVSQIKNWTAARAERAIATLADGVQKTRRSPALSDVAAVRALWSVALAARPRR
jgi:DNA polymerase-3 subunit delta